MERVILGLSGGVDSAASAILLSRSGYRVHGVYMDNGSGSPERAEAAAHSLGIDFTIIDARDIFRRQIIEPFIESYLSGRTPNPCVTCNPLVKFKTLFDFADENGAQFVATGHYARTENGFIYRGTGPNDQSYMLCRLPVEWVRRIILPLGAFSSKDEVRAVTGQTLPDLSKTKASMDICFIPDGDYASFIEQNASPPPPGDLVDETGRVIGHHGGIHRTTVGMRRGLGVSAPGRLYVTRVDPAANRVTLSPKSPTGPRKVMCENAYWFQHPLPGKWYGVRLRHSRSMGRAQLISEENKRFVIHVEDCRDAAASGQYAVLYDGDCLIGGGIIYNYIEY